mmetsp:Transcript_37028/g.115243  ORF Transcript_37028/g.115243 Transcript_37028/m.115243 type:complete len:350 (-) Transcript_37028:954-2003(-)
MAANILRALGRPSVLRLCRHQLCTLTTHKLRHEAAEPGGAGRAGGGGDCAVRAMLRVLAARAPCEKQRGPGRPVRQPEVPALDVEWNRRPRPVRSRLPPLGMQGPLEAHCNLLDEFRARKADPRGDVQERRILVEPDLTGGGEARKAKAWQRRRGIGTRVGQLSGDLWLATDDRQGQRREALNDAGRRVLGASAGHALRRRATRLLLLAADVQQAPDEFQMPGLHREMQRPAERGAQLVNARAHLQVPCSGRQLYGQHRGRTAEVIAGAATGHRQAERADVCGQVGVHAILHEPVHERQVSHQAARVQQREAARGRARALELQAALRGLRHVIHQALCRLGVQPARGGG